MRKFTRVQSRSDTLALLTIQKLDVLLKFWLYTCNVCVLCGGGGMRQRQSTLSRVEGNWYLIKISAKSKRNKFLKAVVESTRIWIDVTLFHACLYGLVNRFTRTYITYVALLLLLLKTQYVRVEVLINWDLNFTMLLYLQYNIRIHKRLSSPYPASPQSSPPSFLLPL